VDVHTIRRRRHELTAAGYLRHSAERRDEGTRYRLIAVTPSPGWDSELRAASEPAESADIEKPWRVAPKGAGRA
jgi:hypothetical protein